MIARFWDALFDYADKVKESGDTQAYKIVHDIEDILQKTYNDGMEYKCAVTDWKPKRQIDKLVGSIPDIEVYRDPADEKIFWELDGKYFDYPEEVIKYLIDFRTRKACKEVNKFKALFLQAVHESIKDFRAVDVLSQPRTINERRKDNE